MPNKISTITVVRNDADHIRETMESFFSQTWQDKEYIVIDGGSTDGTAEIIKEYSDRLAYWCSEPDHGIYDAMNKGIEHATGDWINILNSGDLYTTKYSLENAINNLDTKELETADVIYGDSVERNGGSDIYQEASSDIDGMKFGPVFRHGSSLIRAKIQKLHMFDTSLANKYGFSLDWLMLHTLYKENKKFVKTNAIIETYLTEGVSNDKKKSLEYNRIIVSNKPLNIIDKVHINRTILISKFKQTLFYEYLISFLTEFILNDVIPHISSWKCRKAFMNFVKMRIGDGAFIMKHNYIITPQRLRIGNHSHINRNCTLDARGTITIGDNVSISHGVAIMTGSHDKNSPNFQAKFLPIRIDDYAWIGVNATILQNIHIGKGAVVCAGAVVTHDVKPYTIVGGIPAREIGKRNENLKYQCNGFELFR